MPEPVPQELEAALDASAARRGRLGDADPLLQRNWIDQRRRRSARGRWITRRHARRRLVSDRRSRPARPTMAFPAGRRSLRFAHRPERQRGSVSDARRRRGRSAGNHARDSAACSNQVAERHHRARQCATISAAQARRDPCRSIFWRRRPHLRHPRLWHQPQDDGVSAGTGEIGRRRSKRSSGAPSTRGRFLRRRLQR